MISASAQLAQDLTYLLAADAAEQRAGDAEGKAAAAERELARMRYEVAARAPDAPVAAVLPQPDAEREMYTRTLEESLEALSEEHAALQRERDSMAEELSAITPEFFDEVEDLKFNYARAQAELAKLEAARREA